MATVAAMFAACANDESVEADNQPALEAGNSYTVTIKKTGLEVCGCTIKA